MELHATSRSTAPSITGILTSGVPLHPLRSMTWFACAWLIAACSSGGAGAPPNSSTGPVPQAVTKVTLVLSSDANDQYTRFSAVLQGITLTNTRGKAVTLLSQSLGTEFVHVNNLVEPVITVTVPQDTYTAVSVKVGAAQFDCETLNASGGVMDSAFVYGYMPANAVSSSMPAPIAVAGDSMGMTLRMSVQRSAIFSSCSTGASYEIRPTFTLTSFDITNDPHASASNSVFSLEGAVTTIGGTSGSFVLQRPAYMSEAARSLTVNVDENTVVQGVDGVAALGVGMFVDLDGTVQADGSVHATRVAVANPVAVDVRRGPILTVDQNAHIVDIKPIEGQGKDEQVNVEEYDTSSTTFLVSSQLSNVQQLPFTASFTAASMVPGQNVYTSSPEFVTCCGALYYAPATTITLMPQTINATVVRTATSGNFTVYTVALAASDPFVDLATQPAQETLLTQPNQVQVYVDGSTRMLNSDPIAIGNTLRFYGLVFNDQGVLRMDCAQTNDGVLPAN